MFPIDWGPEKKKQEPPPEKFYFEVEVDPAQRIALLDLVRWRIAKGGTSAALRAYLKKLELEILCARRIDRPMIRERLPWDLARERGCSEVELFEDLAHAKGDE